MLQIQIPYLSESVQIGKLTSSFFKTVSFCCDWCDLYIIIRLDGTSSSLNSIYIDPAYASVGVLCYNSIDDVFAVGFEDTGSEKCSPAKSDNYHKFRPSLSYTCNQKLRTS